MPPTGELLIGGGARRGSGGGLQGVDPATGRVLDPAFGGATKADLAEACALAAVAFGPYRATSPEARARFLETIAERIEAIGDDLIVRSMAETGLPRARLEGERGRTTGQLRLFAGVLRDGGWLEARIDPALPDRKPLPRPDLRLRNVPLGPVAVFGASNFPLAFSVAGGDSASALAAGCPVVVKAHPAHPGTSELVGRAVQEAVAAHGLPAGVFALLHDAGVEISQALVADPRIKAVGFTGSRRAGLALAAIVQARPEPIPVYAEMSSINPVLLLPAALAARGPAIARDFVAALTQGAGQFCTNPGLVLAIEGPGLDAFLATAAQALGQAPAATMLTAGICANYAAGVRNLAERDGVAAVGQGQSPGPGEGQGQAALFATSAETFGSDPRLHEEVFGAASLVVRCPDAAALRAAIAELEGQLTVALHMDPDDTDLARDLLPELELKAGRVLVNGFGTGVEVGHAMVHGGPFPATSDSRATSVGSLAIARFLRPVCYQNLPQALLPPELRGDNPLGLVRRIDGKLDLA
ncbi:MAG: aldehyde dehydrogenase (NADP(+)) [Phenylobacterium sp.]|uniref:aldehyde dehydrogenase (NADP(+)) n=1 Tax=Phenylobacterium sp. TaxID=1871053 RepID=UPI002732C66E|nr:aldehyde dehydrogenase (NADP(+)) [Phenylobacterium sp.]MDP3748079.1 aldehyde dehydrogenase (NADP(+)) [Phenylobacterium sp.]